MRILIVSPTLPYPLLDGGRKGVYYPVKYLSARGHHVHFACLTDRHDEAAYLEMKKFGPVTITFNDHTPSIAGALFQAMHETSYFLSRYHNVIHLEKILKLLHSNFDVVQLEGVHSVFYGLAIKKVSNIPIVLRSHSIDSVNVGTYKEKDSLRLRRAYFNYEIRKLRSYEKKYCGLFDRIAFVSKNDEDVFHQLNPHAKTTVIPSGVELKEFTSNNVSESSEETVLWIGALKWYPNQDSFWWFYRNIVPLIVARNPNVIIEVVGSNPPDDIIKIRHPNVQIIGEVEDVRPYYNRARVCVVPLRSGSGIRMKLLEMFSMQKAVVSTPLGCEGLAVNHLDHLWIADTEEGFAEGVDALLKNPQSRKQMGINGRKFVEDNYSWERIAILFEDLYQEIIKNK